MIFTLLLSITIAMLALLMLWHAYAAHAGTTSSNVNRVLK
jgi:hypothetical protein